MKTLKQLIEEIENQYGTPVLIDKEVVPDPTSYLGNDDEGEDQENVPATPKAPPNMATEEWPQLDLFKKVKKPNSGPKERTPVVMKHDGLSGLVKHFETNHDNNHLGDHVVHVHKKMEDHYAWEHQKLSHGHTEELNKYTSSSMGLNRFLFNHHMEGKSAKNIPWKFKDTDFSGKTHNLRHLDDALKQTPVPEKLANEKGHIHVYSGVKFHPGEEAAKNGGRLFLPAYTSTSIHPAQARRFAEEFQDSEPQEDGTHKTTINRHILKIKVKKNFPGHYIGDRSNFPSEREFIMPRRAQLMVHPTPDVHHYEDDYGNKSKVHVWHAEARTIGTPKIKAPKAEPTEPGSGI